MNAIPIEDAIHLIRSHLHTAVLGDVLDVMGYPHQFLPARIQPIAPDMKLVGRAMPVLEADASDDTQPFGLMFEALDALQPGEVYLVSGGSMRYALWGELMTTVALRDITRVLALGLPVFSSGSYGQDQRGRGKVVAYRVTVEIGGVLVKPGDLLVGDRDGVLAIPADLVQEVARRTVDKLRTEERVRQALQQGSTAREAFQTFGVM